MKRYWFQDDDGTFYRNEGLVWREYQTALRRCRFFLASSLYSEWLHVWNKGIVTSDTIGKNDRVATPLPFRISHPNHPGLWVLDDHSGSRDL